jgi:hypothetical protein
MSQEIRFWVSLCGYNGTIDAQASWYCYQMMRIHGYNCSLELGAAAAIFSLKLLSDSHFTTECAVSRHNNKIILQYEREISAIEFGTNKADRITFFSIINDIYKEIETTEADNRIIDGIISRSITENVFSMPQDKVAREALRKIKICLNRPALRRRSYSV